MLYCILDVVEKDNNRIGSVLAEEKDRAKSKKHQKKLDSIEKLPRQLVFKLTFLSMTTEQPWGHYCNSTVNYRTV